MSARPVRLGVVGAGAWARAAHLPSLAADDASEVVAIANRSVESAQAAAELCEGADALDDWRALVAREDLDAVLVTCAVAEHAPVALAALERGLHVLCEAPLATSVADARAMCAAASERNLVTGYVRPRPWLAGGELVRAELEAGAIGQPLRAQLSFRWNPWLLADPDQSWRVRKDPWPPVLSGIVAGMSSELFGPIAEVCGSLAVVAPAAPHAERAPNQLDALLRTHSGVLVSAQAGWSPQPVPFAGITIYGDAGALVWEWAPPFRVQLCRAGAQSWEERPPTIPADLGAAWTPTREFVAAVRAGASGALDFGRGLHELCVAEALERSSASGRFESVDAS